MKKIFTLLSLLACMFVNAQEAKETMRVHSNGEVTEFAVADIDSVTFVVPEWTEWEDLGTCSYTFAGIYDGVKEGLTLSYRQSNYNDNEAEFKVPGLFGDGWDLVVKYDRITGQCSVPVQQVMKHDTYRAIYVSDMPNYPLTPGLSYEKYPCTYNAETGTITLTLVYFVSINHGSTDNGYFAAGVTETIQLDGMGGNEPIASIEDFEGDWVVPGTYNGKAYECIGNISVVDIEGTEYLLCSGFADAASFGYTSDEFVMLFDAETGRVTLPTQEAPDFTYQGQVYSVMVVLANYAEMRVFSGSLVGKLVGNKIKFVNAEGNKYQADSFVHYAPDLGLISNFNQLEWTRYDASNAPAKVAHEKSVIKKGEFKVTGLVTKKNFELIKL